jgi:hypothetical protein
MFLFLIVRNVYTGQKTKNNAVQPAGVQDSIRPRSSKMEPFGSALRALRQCAVLRPQALSGYTRS